MGLVKPVKSVKSKLPWPKLAMIAFDERKVVAARQVRNKLNITGNCVLWGEDALCCIFSRRAYDEGDVPQLRVVGLSLTVCATL